jgi:hypothetical protein
MSAAPAPESLPSSPASEDDEKPDKALTAKNKKIAKALLTRVAGSKTVIKDKIPQWQANVEQRMGIVSTASGAPGVETETTQQVELNPDWSLTKTKTANLYSQVPTVQGTHENVKYAPAIAPFMKSVNYEISEKRTHMGVAMQECLADVVNASGFAGMMVGYAARFVNKEVPAIDLQLVSPEDLEMLKAANAIPMTMAPQLTDQRLFATRISPKDLLVPQEFVGSNFDDGAYIGYKGRKPWAEAKSEWKLKDEDKELFVSADQPNTTEQLTVQTDATHSTMMVPDDSVEFEELYYWRYRFDPEEPSFCAIWKLIHVNGQDEPVVHEPWRGQRLVEDGSGRYVGNKKFPIRVLTLTYVSDNAIPPSDTEAGYPHVMDLRRSRAQMFANRKHSIPMRWYDVSRLDPLVAEQIKRGEWQGLIPVNGDGSRSLGELARASYPSEDLTFDRNTKSDLQEAWQLGPNQLGNVGNSGTTKGESSIVQQNFATRIGQERAQVAAFFLGAVEVLAGWMCLYSDFPILSDQERQTMEQAWDQRTILHDLVLKIRPDSTIVLDVNQQLERIFKFINLTAKSGYVNVKPLIVQAAELSGVDPAEVVVDPQPKKPEDPNISYRFTGKDDMQNPMVLGILQKRGELPTIEELKAVIAIQKQMLQLAQAPMPESNPADPAAMPPPMSAGQPGPPAPGAPDANPDWQLAPTIAKRQRDV